MGELPYTRLTGIERRVILSILFSLSSMQVDLPIRFENLPKEQDIAAYFDMTLRDDGLDDTIAGPESD